MNDWRRPLKLHKLLEELENDELTVPPDEIILFPPENANDDNTDCDSGDEELTNLNNFPGSQLRNEVELVVLQANEYDSDDDIPLAQLYLGATLLPKTIDRNTLERARAHWLCDFIRRTKLSLRKPQQTSLARSIAFNRYYKHINKDRLIDNRNTKLLRRTDNTVILDWYIKPTSSGRYINYKSYHPMKMKINLVLAMKNRIVKISHPSLREKNIKLFCLPFIKDLSTRVINLFSDENVKIAQRNVKPVGNLYTKLKDKNDDIKKINVVYSIPCHNCELSYVGQTTRSLKDRIVSHKSDCNVEKRSCALAEHVLDTGHHIDYNNTRILHVESNLGKRLFLEMIEINKNRQVVARKGSKQVGAVASAERGTNVTLIAAINVIGCSVPPMFVFPRKFFKEYMLKGARIGSIGTANPSGWSTGDIFIKYLKHFINVVKPTPENKILLIVDNHESHLSIPAINMAREHGVIMLTFPPHTSHRLQPLDRSVFGPFKKYYNQACHEWLLNNPGKPMTIYEVAECVGKSYPRAFTPSNIESGFRVSGIFPLNRHVFQEHEFLP
ncbi:hypothetical protein NQ315_011632 [Exocentrus adspersus]|uniref:DDE-1 domain-containing protein n=1 Tax=Exocentrus adspersus TaxID=1586481 RepID=A0AAV8V8W1_9CUCU|nr:hypothetical protein NQ315_011632 [Exocentrus adspersus]